MINTYVLTTISPVMTINSAQYKEVKRVINRITKVVKVVTCL